MTQHKVFGLEAKNGEQRSTLLAACDLDTDLVIINGPAGTGKTLMAVASALETVVNKKQYRQIVITKAAVEAGRDIGFLPGTEEEKMAPWLGGIFDSLDLLGDQTAEYLVSRYFKILSLAFMRGRSFSSTYLIVDEAQNLTYSEFRMILSRMVTGSKLVIIGDLSQSDIHAPAFGAIYNKCRKYKHGACITLSIVERSRLARFVHQEFTEALCHT